MILDTNALSALAEGDPDLERLLKDEAILSVPVIALGEYLFGIGGSRERVALEGWLGQMLMQVAVLHIEAQTAYHYAVLRSDLKSRGTPIPQNDLWIAALARQYSLAVVTRDHHFGAVPGVQSVGW